jgi:hypothetical protein
MTPQTISAIDCTVDLIRFAKSRIDKHADDFARDESLAVLTAAQKCLDEASRLLKQAPTLENLPMVLRTSLKVVDQERCARTAEE